MNVTVNEIQQLQQQQARIRNMCILAHVDHGKTTLSDHLIAMNGLIHPKMVGELRYLDSRDDEQARGITMKSSSISLLYVPGAAQRPEGPRSVSSAEKLSSGYLINLIDSPGHVDFCSEVSTAARLSDGALVVVDAVEGVCIQTHAVLRQAWEEKVKPCLMINKLDRLITELKLSPSEAATRLTGIVAHANMIWSAFDSEHFMREADAVLAAEQQQQQQREGGGDTSAPEAAAAADQDEEDVFQPCKGNVAFGSASDSWAFRLDQFADMYSAKLGAKPAALVQALWGDWCYLPKEKRVVRGSKARSAAGGRSAPRSMFEQFALEPIWRAYSVCEPEGEGLQAVLGPIVSSRSLTHLVPSKLLEASADPRAAVKAVLKAWLPLSEAVLGMAVSHLPSPDAAAPLRLPHLLAGGNNTALLPLAAAGAAAVAGVGASGGDGSSSSTNGVLDDSKGGDGSSIDAQEAAAAAAAADVGAEVECDVACQLERTCSHLCASSSAVDAPLVVFVSKMVAVPANLLPRRVGEAGEQGEGVSGEVFLAFARVFSGVAREGARVHVLSQAYDPRHPDKQRQTAVLRGLYLMMGRSLERLSSVPAGNVLALSGLETSILKSATLSSSPACLPLAPMTFQAAPIVRVALEPSCPTDMAALAAGLKLLNRADPFVEVGLSEKGEHLLGAAGEVHLETVIKDLQERFARVDFQVSPPLVAFKESVLCGVEGSDGTTTSSSSSSSSKTAKVVEAATPSGVCVVRVRAHALPNTTAALLDEHAHLIKDLLEQQHRKQEDTSKHKQQQQQQGGAGQSSNGIQQQQQQGSSSSNSSKRQRGSIDGGDRSREANKLREAYSHSTQDAAHKPLAQLLHRAWLLGPRNVGPNIALCSPCRADSSSSSSTTTTSSSSGGSLFDVPSSQVVRTSSKHGPLSKLTGAAGTDAAAAAAKHHADFSSSGGSSSMANGSVAAAAHEASQVAAEAAGAAAAADAAQQLQQIHVPFGWPSAAALLSAASPAAAATHSRDGCASSSAAEAAAAAGVSDLWPHIAGSVESGVTAGFQLAAAAGPLCDEPLWGVVFDVEVVLVVPPGGGTALDLAEGVYGPFSGQVMGAMCAACRRAVLESDPRLVEALYLCQVQAAAEALSGVYAVLGRRRARILQEELREGSGSFLVHAYLPVEASFGLADEMRRRSSGAASASLLLSHWERLAVDPFFVPTTEEELEEYGTEAGGPANLARRLIDAVRRRKGLPVEEKVVAKATKQRTLKRNV